MHTHQTVLSVKFAGKEILNEVAVCLLQVRLAEAKETTGAGTRFKFPDEPESLNLSVANEASNMLYKPHPSLP